MWLLIMWLLIMWLLSCDSYHVTLIMWLSSCFIFLQSAETCRQFDFHEQTFLHCVNALQQQQNKHNSNIETFNNTLKQQVRCAYYIYQTCNFSDFWWISDFFSSFLDHFCELSRTVENIFDQKAGPTGLWHCRCKCFFLRRIITRMCYQLNKLYHLYAYVAYLWPCVFVVCVFYDT